MRKTIGWIICLGGFACIGAGVFLCSGKCEGYCTEVIFDNKCLLWWGFSAVMAEILGLLLVSD
jgi:hypothetical protein